MPPGRAVCFVCTNDRERTLMQYLLRFLRRGPISPRVHGTLDYLLAAALIAVPLAVDFHDDTATVLMLVLGGAATLLAIGTNWSTGIIRILPPALHGVADIAATIVLIIAPFVLGFTRAHGRDRALRRDRCRRIGRNAADPLRVRSGAGRAHRSPTARCLRPRRAPRLGPTRGPPSWRSLTTRRRSLLRRATTRLHPRRSRRAGAVTQARDDHGG